MKRAMPWSDEEDNSSLSSSSLDTDAEAEAGDGSSGKKPKNKKAAVGQGKVLPSQFPLKQKNCCVKTKAKAKEF